LSIDRRSAYIDRMGQTTSTKPKRAGTPQSGPSLYDTDIYAWSLEQARLLQEGRFEEVDAQNVAEEILDVGRTEYRVLESALRVLLMHMLKWDHQPERRTRSWENTIREQRLRTEEQLQDNPSLKARLDEAVERAYRLGRLAASSEIDMEVARFPETCPYGWEEIMERDFTRAAEKSR
jgi:hypothetical protein